MNAKELDLQGVSDEALEAALKQRKEAKKKAKIQQENKYKKDKDAFIESTIIDFQQFNKMLSNFKDFTLKRGIELYNEMYKVYDREPKDHKSMTLESEDGQFKIVLENQERVHLDDSAKPGIEMIQEVLKEKFEGRNKTMYDIINSILIKNSKGDYDPKLVSKLRKHVDKVSDPRFTEGLDIIAKAFKTVGTSRYVRAYKRDENGKFQDIVIQFSAL